MLVRGGRLIDPAQGLDARLDLRLHAGVVAEIGEHLASAQNEPVIDAQGAYVAPGFIDMHVHLREPGNPEKETLETGSAAAAAGGFTAVAAMPNTRPALDEPGILRAVAHAQPSERIRARIFVIAAITKGRAGAQPVDFAALAAAGAVAFSDDGSTVMNARVLRDAAQAAGAVPGCFIVHCEDAQLKGEAVRDDGGLAEESIVARDLQIARATGKAWHIAHLSTARALQLVRDARACGTRVTCEVAPHHLHFTDALIETLGAGAKVNPPLRAAADVEALRAAVMREEIEAFASDHAPHTEQEKRADLATGAVGFSGLEIAVGAYALAVPQLPLSRFVAMCSTNPARILNVPGGALRLGDPADVTVFADRPWIVRSRAFRSKGTSTPFEGMTLPRRVLATICGGEVTYQAEAA